MAIKIVDSKDVRTRKAAQTGAYVGPGGDSRYYKAGDDIPATYTFSHDVDTRGYRERDPNYPAFKKGAK
jgi:serine/threonine protein phosphatase PrpC